MTPGMAEGSERKRFEAPGPFLAESLRELSDAELFSLWEQAQYGQRGEQSYREWLRRTGYPDMRSAWNAYCHYQAIARHLQRVYGMSCAEISDLSMRERRRRQRLRDSRRR